ncbi:MAG: hypothetical protein J4400_03435, partial [Candidatus Aenigmarchaeota archaeon]|nr:hypothetical protein [Candidatus Aenigmarchaeota archaeon]
TEPRREYSGTIKRTEKGFQIIAGEGMSVTDQTLDYINEFLDGNFVHKNEFLLTTALYDIIFSLDMSEKMPSVIKALEYDARYEQLPESRKKQLRNSDTIRKLKETALISRRALEGFRDYIVSAQTLSGVNYNEIMGNERFFSDWHNHPINFSRNPEDYGPSKTDVAGSFTTGPKIVFVRVDGIAHAFAINRGHVKEIYTTKID